MQPNPTDMRHDVLDAQKQHWEQTFGANPEMYGAQPSAPAHKAVEVFRQADISKVLELGAGQGRDALYFAHRGLHVSALDYSQCGVDAIRQKAQALGLAQSVTAFCRDIRKPLPFTDAAFGGCYSHMALCMALTMVELEALSDEIRRVLQPGGLHIYTVRHTHDAHYRQGIHHGEHLYETGGFIVHFFSRETVEQLAQGFEILEVEEFEEGELPRRLFCVTLRKR